MNKFVFLLLIGLSVIMTACDKSTGEAEDKQTLWIFNNSSNAIKGMVSAQAPSSAIPEDKAGLFDIPVQQYMAHVYFEKTWDEVYSKIPNDTITVFIFDPNVVGANDWADVRKNKMYLRRYTFTKAELKTANGKVTYQ